MDSLPYLRVKNINYTYTVRFTGHMSFLPNQIILIYSLFYTYPIYNILFDQLKKNVRIFIALHLKLLLIYIYTQVAMIVVIFFLGM